MAVIDAGTTPDNTYMSASSAVIWTDKASYLPEETVIIYGSGFNPDAQIDLTVTRPDDTVDADSFPADSYGDFVYYYVLDGILGSYLINATDGTYNAFTWFEDGSGGFSGKVDYRQFATKDSEWINGILQGSNSLYYECMSVPQRLILTDIQATTGDSHTLTFSHMATKQGIHAYDWLTAWDQSNDPPLIDPDSLAWGPQIASDLVTICENLHTADGISGYFILVEVPDDPFTSDEGSTQDRIDAYESLWGNRYIRLCGNEPFSSASLSLSHDVADGGDTDDSYINYVLTWESESDQILVEMAGHLALSGDPQKNEAAWGVGLGAAFAPGGSYHFMVEKVDDLSLGKRDNQIMGSAIEVVAGRKGGYKWEDVNGDGIWDPGEEVMVGWPVYLKDTENNILATEYTNASGYYLFENLALGDYIVEEDLPSGWTCTYPGPSGSYSFTVTSGFEDLDNNFGNFQWFTISGYKYLDWDDTHSSMLYPLEGWTINLYKYNDITADWNFVTSDLTDGGGFYSFEVEQPGTYRIMEELKDRWTQTYPHLCYSPDDGSDVTVNGYEIGPVTSGASYTDKNFWNFQWLTISGYKYEDIDGTHTSTAYPLDGWTISLFRNLVPYYSVLTGDGSTWSLGYYEFLVTDPGTYQICEDLQSGWIETYPPIPHSTSSR